MANIPDLIRTLNEAFRDARDDLHLFEIFDSPVAILDRIGTQGFLNLVIPPTDGLHTNFVRDAAKAALLGTEISDLRKSGKRTSPFLEVGRRLAEGANFVLQR